MFALEWRSDMTKGPGYVDVEVPASAWDHACAYIVLVMAVCSGIPVVVLAAIHFYSRVKPKNLSSEPPETKSEPSYYELEQREITRGVQMMIDRSNWLFLRRWGAAD